MIGRLIALLFFARDVTHREHLKTTSYAQHVALNEFYEAIVGNADSIAEAYQGRNGIMAVYKEDDQEAAWEGTLSNTANVDVNPDGGLA